MFRHVPNLLTGGRLVLAIVFFAMLSYYQHQGRGDPWFLNTAFLIYLVALVTDFLDGYLARKWKVEGAFGRVVDPFVDKVLVLGSFIFFAGKNFIIPETVHPEHMHMVVKTLTGVAPWMVVILLAHELLITTLRGISLAGGPGFGAAFAGKVKMVVQSATILIILVYVNYLRWLESRAWEHLAANIRDAFIWLTIIVTVFSGISYIRKASVLYRQEQG